MHTHFFTFCVVTLCILVPVPHVSCDDLPACQPKDFHYEYTECDSNGGRWRVSVPDPDKCTGGAPNAPIRGKDCSFTCKEGEFLDIANDQECHTCPPGTYSLGGGVRFDDWETIPTGFTVSTEGFQHHLLWRNNDPETNCSRSTWQPKGNYIAALPGACTTSLVFSTKLVTAGMAMFEYQYTDPDTIFHFLVQNDQCQAAGDDESSQWPKITDEGQWHKQTVKLKSGMNVLQWRTIGVMSDMAKSKTVPILIRNIEISGVAFTSECTRCRNGTYSSGGTNFCTLCPENTYSSRGEGQCHSCDTTKEYSLPGSSQCLKKPACVESDYFEHQSPCTNKKTMKSYSWVKPQICNPQDPNSVTIPADGKPEDCPPCNPGMHLVNGSHCEFCSADTHSDGKEECSQCPVSTSPLYSIDYRWWNTMPPNVTSSCLSMTATQCSKQVGWLTAGDHIRTNFGRDKEIFIILTMQISGLRGHPGSVDGKATVLGKISFMFDIECVGDCELVFLSNESGRNTIVKSWQGSTIKTPFVYELRHNYSQTFTWAFQPVDWDFVEEDKTKDYLNNVARIYSIDVTNTLSGGATACKACPRGLQKDGCIPCPDGHYIDPISTTCTPCPHGTVMSSSDPWGIKACHKCGDGMKAVNGHHCESDCKIVDNQGKSYDLSALDRLQFVTGTRLFTSSGTTYYHGFNISLCGHNTNTLPTCVNNVTAQDEDGEKATKSEEFEVMTQQTMLNIPSKVSGMICRSTLVPEKDSVQNSVVSTQPVSIGDHLVKIINNASLKKQYEEEGFSVDKMQNDIHFYYRAESATAACPDGRQTIISVRCEVDKKQQGQIELPPKCSDGTCDGCNFHFLWHTQHACPLCRDEDYEIVNGECINGEQTIHYYPPKDCLLPSVTKPKKMKQKCTTIPLVIQISIPAAIGVGLLLMILLVYCWKRNKKLEYRYMKLVETAGGREGELPAAESCGLDDEDDDEAVHFSESKGVKLFQKLRIKMGGGSSKDDDNPFVAVRVHEKVPLT
ncbi:endosome/lysosome-associated apoptosis and autophagy regulator family member 2 isoform X2 [Patella vulgata]|uniref:endosome/lysosome-associated apoptosis and autophagy regulator family member 2 isoform X2 n=1 Tax=Patella vulgata TaxID=6465 RepID=UPI00217F477A|nr:endosome/lysosome-associated apoptosis and autophagy regulator family member 2 isoform X2 [Patella vulgata]